MYLNYAPGSRGKLNYEAMDNLPEPVLNPEEKTALQVVVNNIKSWHLSGEDQQDDISETDHDSGIDLDSLSESADDLTPTPSEQDELQPTDDKPVETSPEKKPSRWFSNCSIQ